MPPELQGMKALSVRQPWVWAIFHAGKDIENRDWSERYQGLRDARRLADEYARSGGGDFLIHASAGMTRAEYEDFIDTVHAISRTHPLPVGLRVPAMVDLRKGGIVGIATLAGVVLAHPSPWFFGPIGLLLRNVRPLPFMPCKGALGFFRPDVTNG